MDVQKYKEIIERLENGYKPSLDELLDELDCCNNECPTFDGVFITPDCKGMINIMDTNEYENNRTAIDIITRDKLDSTEIVACAHSTTLPFDIHIPLPEDGCYTVYHVVLPNIEWLELLKDVNAYKKVYVADSLSVFEYKDGDLYLIDPLILTTKLPEKNTTIKYLKSLLNLLFLWKCFIDKCEEYLKNLHPSKEETNEKSFRYYLNKKLKKCDSLEIDDYAIDFLFLTLNLLQCLGYSEEAEEILERIGGCGGFCSDTTLNNNKSNCNCKK